MCRIGYFSIVIIIIIIIVRSHFSSSPLDRRLRRHASRPTCTSSSKQRCTACTASTA